MSDVVIQIENLSKYYRLGQIGGGTLREDLNGWWARVRGKPDPLAEVGGPEEGGRSEGEIWALRDVAFDVRGGEIVGIIGRNGAGKSTLLKILSRITAPTSGVIRIRGRIGSMLEVGTGFHPELTGRENIFLNGSILGMRKAEIASRLDEIIAFSGIEKFVDTPVKRYSSGMYVRLAFSVAAHLEPEILIVDEVLAVGDLAFQKKCLGKMEDVAAGGRTVLFVSHNMQAVRTLCKRGILLDAGRISVDTSVDGALVRYNEMLRDIRVDETTSVSSTRHRRGSGAARFTGIRLMDVGGVETHNFRMGDTVRIVLSYTVRQDVPALWVQVQLRSGLSGDVVTSVRYAVSATPVRANFSGSLELEFGEVPLRPGDYPLYFWLGDSLDLPYDIVDDLTLPLIVGPPRPSPDVDDIVVQGGLFSIPSKLIARSEKPSL